MEIVGLKTLVPDDVNKLIVKFLGYQTRTAKALKDKRLEYDDYYRDECPEELDENAFLGFSKYLKVVPKLKRLFIVIRATDKLRNVKSIIKRRDEFTKLRPWLRRFVLKWGGYSIFPPINRNNRRFIEAQINELKMRGSAWCTSLLEW